MVFERENKGLESREEIVRLDGKVGYMRGENEALMVRLDEVAKENLGRVGVEKKERMEMRKKIEVLEEESQKGKVVAEGLRKQNEFFRSKLNGKFGGVPDTKERILVGKLIGEVKKVLELKNEVSEIKQNLKSQLIEIENLFIDRIDDFGKKWKGDVRTIYGLKSQIDYLTEKQIANDKRTGHGSKFVERSGLGGSFTYNGISK
jgi:hypothetical protein